MRKKYKKRRKDVKLFKITVILTALTVLLVLCFNEMRPVIINHAVSVAETTMLDSANDAIIEILDEQKVSYGDIVHLNENSQGLITSIETDVVEINRLKSSISNRLSEIISEREYYTIKIPVGTFLSNVYTAGIGPELTFNMQLTSTAVVTFKHAFISAGINQVLHRVEVNIDISGKLVVAGFTDDIKVSTSAIAAQTVIAGAVPEAFTQVTEDAGSNLAGLINDYGAIAGE